MCSNEHYVFIVDYRKNPAFYYMEAERWDELMIKRNKELDALMINKLTELELEKAKLLRKGEPIMATKKTKKTVKQATKNTTPKTKTKKK